LMLYTSCHSLKKNRYRNNNIKKVQIMIKFWTIAILMFIVIAFILSKLTLKQQRKEMGDRVWKLWYGRSTYWQLLALSSFGITMAIMLVMHWIGIPILT
jgi:hypothetical protein